MYPSSPNIKFFIPLRNLFKYKFRWEVYCIYIYPPEVETSFRWFPTGSQFDLFRSYISYRKSFLHLKLPLVIGFFETSDFFIAWMVVVDGGGWWWMVVDGTRKPFWMSKKTTFSEISPKLLDKFSWLFLRPTEEF